MTVRRLAALRKRWVDCPPADRLMAAYVGYKPPEPKQYMDADAAKEFMKLTGGKIPGVAKMSGPPS